MDCYRTCDIRGKYPDEINEALFYQFGRNIAQKLLCQKTILIGSDLRMSSPALKEALSDGLVNGGAQVYDAGRVPTPVLYFGKRKLGVFAAAMVTASHNPPDENGLKLLLGRYPATAAQLRSLKPEGALEQSSHTPGRVEAVELSEPYFEFLVRIWRDRLRSAARSGDVGSFIFDPGNGTWTLLINEIIRRLEITATVIHAAPDGRFPERSPDCCSLGSLLPLASKVRQGGASAGLAWDGDGDRLAVCDNTGRVLFTDHLVLLMLPGMLRHTRRETILCDVKMSKRIKATIEMQDAIPIIEKSAHCYLENRMINEDCLFGCECSGHLFFRSLGGADDGVYAALCVVDFLRHRGIPLSDLLRVIPELHITPDLRIPGGPGDFIQVRRRLRDGFPAGIVTSFDGLKIETLRAWFLVRPSVSESKLSFRFEGETPEELESIIDRVLRLLPAHAEFLEEQLLRWRGVLGSKAA